VSESLFSANFAPLTIRESSAHRQEHEGVYEAHARIRDERREFQSEGHCGSPYCPCQVKCRPLEKEEGQ
jgi:hypothetical protein